MNQYQACLYLFESISHGDSKYGHEIPDCWYFWKNWDILDLLSAQCSRLRYGMSVKESVKLSTFCGGDLTVIRTWFFCLVLILRQGLIAFSSLAYFGIPWETCETCKQNADKHAMYFGRWVNLCNLWILGGMFGGLSWYQKCRDA